jgi:hypothetical protein
MGSVIFSKLIEFIKVSLILILCAYPQYDGVSLSGERWIFGFPFVSAKFLVSDHSSFDVSARIFLNIIIWLVAFSFINNWLLKKFKKKGRTGQSGKGKEGKGSVVDY